MHKAYLFQLETCLLSWHSRKQSIVALSSRQAEYISATIATKELIWLQSIIQELGYSLSLSITIYCDNQSCIAFSQNLKFHNHSKHIDLRYHFLHEKINTHLLSLEYMPTSTMWADILTKSLSKFKHFSCLEGIHHSASSTSKQGGILSLETIMFNDFMFIFKFSSTAQGGMLVE